MLGDIGWTVHSMLLRQRMLGYFPLLFVVQPYWFNSGYVSGIPDLKRTHRLAWLTWDDMLITLTCMLEVYKSTWFKKLTKETEIQFIFRTRHKASIRWTIFVILMLDFNYQLSLILQCKLKHRGVMQRSNSCLMSFCRKFTKNILIWANWRVRTTICCQWSAIKCFGLVRSLIVPATGTYL